VRTREGDRRSLKKENRMSLNLRTIRIPTLAVSAGIALAALAVTGGAASADPVLHASQSCTPPKYPGQGYFTGKIRVTNISCSYGKRFVVAYYKCRTKGSRPAGRCTTKVLGFSCTEKRETIPTEIDARVTCRRGTQRIVHTYQQNLE
jgi:hypothetical protein